MSHGIHDTPRGSFLGADRVWGFNVDFHGASLVTSSHGPGAIPAYSEDSDILAVSFAEPAPDGEGGIVCRRIPGEHDGKEWTSLKPTGGANSGSAWCPTNNKFYLGIGQHQLDTSKGMVAVFDPIVDTCEIIGGFSPVDSLAVAQRAIWIPTTGRVWVQNQIGTPKVFSIIDPSDNSYTWLEDSSLLGPNDMCLVGGELWISKTLGGARVFRIDVSTLTPTLTLSETIFETWLGAGVTAWSVGAIEYIASIFKVWVHVSFNQGFGVESFLLELNSTTGAIVGYVSPSPGVFKSPAAFMHYSPEFDRVILSNSTSGFLRSCNPADLSETTVSTTDGMTAAKGCFCTTLNKVALPVLTGPGGARFHTVNFYSAADLGA
jgi:hypothetical protein